jgi:hypothetical protein
MSVVTTRIVPKIEVQIFLNSYAMNRNRKVMINGKKMIMNKISKKIKDRKNY